MKHAILQIGYRRFLMRSSAAAAVAMKALTDAVPVRNHYSASERKEVFVGDEERESYALSIQIVESDQVRVGQKRIAERSGK